MMFIYFAALLTTVSLTFHDFLILVKIYNLNDKVIYQCGKIPNVLLVGGGFLIFYF